MKFWYKEFQVSATEAFPGRTKIYRPIIPFGIESRYKKIGYEVLLDSGADWNLFHSVIGEILGIDVPKGKKQPFGGIGGGNYLAYFHEVTIFIGGWPMKVA